MIKKIFSALLFVLFATTVMAQPGTSCLDPIPVDNGYKAYVDGPFPRVIWYSAGSFDLPMNVFFLPDVSNSTKKPSVVIDFTCDPGQYDDPKLAEAVNDAAELGYALPFELRLNIVNREGKVAYDLNVPKFYRDQMLEYGIDYSIYTVAKVTFQESGWINITPDTTFKSCMDSSPTLKLGDTIDVAANDEQSAYIAPLPSWKNDSIRFVWEGEQPVEMFWANTTCEFVPVSTNKLIYSQFEIAEGTPLKMYSEDIKKHINASTDGGIFFVKFVAPTAGRLVVEKIPVPPAAGGAVVLEYDKPETVNATDATKLFAFSKTWDQATIFNASGKFEMQLSNSHTFDTSLSDVFVISYSSKNIDGKQSVGLSATEMLTLTSNALDHYIYVRFVVDKQTVIVPRLWNVSECVDATTAIEPKVPVYVSSSSNKEMYRILYKDFSGYPILVEWDPNTSSSARLITRILDGCLLNSSNELHKVSQTKRGTTEISASEVDSWASSVDEDGYVYVNFNPARNGSVTFITEKPAEEEPTTPDPINTSFSATVCYGETYPWNDQTYKESGKYTQNFVAVNGADSIVTLNLTVLPEHKPEITEVTVKYGETYTWHNKKYTESATDTVVLKDNNQCDYLAILRLTVLPKPETITTSFSATVCYGETYTWNDQTYGETGNHTQSFVAVNGADSIVTLQLTVLPEHKPEITELTLKYGETYEWQGKKYTESAIDTVALKDENDCDYLAILRLTVLPKPEAVTTTFSATVCYGETYTWNDQIYGETGNHTQSFVAVNGADSIVTLQLTVLPEHKPETTEATIEYGTTYEWNGAIYDATGEYTITLKDENGCEYQATLLLTVNPRPEIPCEQGTIDLNVGDELVLNLDSAFTVFTIDYDAWATTGATLVWTGAEPLHTFVAERCEFAVAPYNKYVIEFVTIPAQGTVVITPSMIASMAGRLDESGYLFVRFLTEKEGVLTIR